jgi:hypothetical protein
LCAGYALNSYNQFRKTEEVTRDRLICRNRLGVLVPKSKNSHASVCKSDLKLILPALSSVGHITNTLRQFVTEKRVEKSYFRNLVGKLDMFLFDLGEYRSAYDARNPNKIRSGYRVGQENGYSYPAAGHSNDQTDSFDVFMTLNNVVTQLRNSMEIITKSYDRLHLDVKGARSQWRHILQVAPDDFIYRSKASGLNDDIGLTWEGLPAAKLSIHAQTAAEFRANVQQIAGELSQSALDVTFWLEHIQAQVGEVRQVMMQLGVSVDEYDVIHPRVLESLESIIAKIEGVCGSIVSSTACLAINSFDLLQIKTRVNLESNKGIPISHSSTFTLPPRKLKMATLKKIKDLCEHNKSHVISGLSNQEDSFTDWLTHSVEGRDSPSSPDATQESSESSNSFKEQPEDHVMFSMSKLKYLIKAASESGDQLTIFDLLPIFQLLEVGLEANPTMT